METQTKKIQEIFNKDFKTEMKNTSEIKNALEGSWSKSDDAKKWVIKDRVVKTTHVWKEKIIFLK